MVCAFLKFIRVRFSIFEARVRGEELQFKISPIFRDLHFTNIHRQNYDLPCTSLIGVIDQRQNQFIEHPLTNFDWQSEFLQGD